MARQRALHDQVFLRSLLSFTSGVPDQERSDSITDLPVAVHQTDSTKSYNGYLEGGLTYEYVNDVRSGPPKYDVRNDTTGASEYVLIDQLSCRSNDPKIYESMARYRAEHNQTYLTQLLRGDAKVTDIERYNLLIELPVSVRFGEQRYPGYDGFLTGTFTTSGNDLPHGVRNGTTGQTEYVPIAQILCRLQEPTKSTSSKRKRKEDTSSTSTTSTTSSSSTSSTSSSSTSSTSSTTIVIPDGHHTIRQKLFHDTTSLETLRSDLSSFAKQRDWDQFHSPRNVALAMVGEVGEIAECFQWKNDEACQNNLEEWKDSKLIHLGEEMSDVLLYLIRLADQCNIDLVAAAKRKLIINGLKYPASQVKGRSAKYTEYKTEWRARAAKEKE